MSLATFVDKFFSLEYTHGLIVRQGGRTLIETYRVPCGPADRHQLFSLSKSFTSTAFGIARGEGLISLEDKLVDFFPEYVTDKVSERMRRVTMRNLLTMSNGHAACCLFGSRYSQLGDGRHFDNDRPWVQNILEDDLAFEPGTQFVYNSGATYLVAAALRKATGQCVLDYLRPRFLRPIGIADDVVWDRDPEGIELGGWGFNLSVRDIAAAAKVWLHQGRGPDGRQLIPEDYMRLATSRQISNGNPADPSDWSQGYGFQFWQCRHGCFRGDGASGQIAVMIPAYDTIVAATAGLTDMQRELDVVWDELLPALEAGETEWTPPAACDAPVFNMGGVGAPNAGFKSLAFDAAPNPLGVVRVEARQVADGLDISLHFADGFEDEIRVGYSADRRSALTHVDLHHCFEGYARAHWLSPTVAEIKLVIPCSTSFFTLKLDAAARTLSSKTPVWFSQYWNADALVSAV